MEGEQKGERGRKREGREGGVRASYIQRTDILSLLLPLLQAVNAFPTSNSECCLLD